MQNFNLKFVRFSAVVCSGLALCAQMFFSGLMTVHAASALGSVVINEVAWAGTLDNSNDEWIELYNPTSQSVEIAGWYVEDDYTDRYTIAEGTIAAHGYFLIEDSENSVMSVKADAVIPLSLANSGDSLILKDPSGAVVDSVNASGGAWYAGSNTTKATMERIDPTVTSDDASNFAVATSSNGATGSLGGAILGTPRGQNSVYQGSVSQTKVEFNLSNESPVTGETVTATAIISNASDLFSYGFDVVYDPTKLEYLSTNEEGFLSENNVVTTSFESALENGQAGKLVIGDARVSKKTGVSGSGNLFTVTFKVIGAVSDTAGLNFGGGSFVTDSAGDTLCSYTATSFKISSNQVGEISGLTVAGGTAVYSAKLTWTAPTAGADNYLIFRKSPAGNFVQIGVSQKAEFVDDDSVTGGGKIVPGINYEYQIKAVKNGIASSPLAVTFKETRGVKGDNDRSGRVDGKDLDNLARHYGANFGESSYNALLDTNFDGTIDGSDLIDLGVNFGFKI